MARVLQVLLITTCMVMIDCGPSRNKFHSNYGYTRSLTKNGHIDDYKDIHHKNFDSNKQVKRSNVRDDDALIFPDSEEHIIQVYLKDDKTTDEANANKPSEINRGQTTTAPFISEVIKSAKATDINEKLSNAIVENNMANLENKEKNKLSHHDIENINNTDEVNETTPKTDNIFEINNDTNIVINANGTDTPDLSGRFGGTGSNSYVLVPVSTYNLQQGYQPVTATNFNVPVHQNYPNYNQVNQNVGNLNNDPMNGQNFPNSNAYVTQPAFNDPNINLNYNNNNQILNYQNVPIQNPNNGYVPVTVPNTYMINGQLYAAVTVPSGTNVPNNLYFINPQVNYQVPNNLPIYQLTSVNNEGVGANPSTI